MEKQSAESRRINAEKEFAAATKGLETAEKTAKNKAKGADGKLPDVAPETQEVQTARDRKKRAQRALNDAQEKENQVNSAIVQQPVGSDPNNNKKKRQQVGLQ